jgi:hypothetical protein
MPCLLVAEYVLSMGGSSLADGLADLGRSEEALAVDDVTYQMTGNMSDGMLLRRGLDEHAKWQVNAAIQTLREVADRDTVFWTFHARTIGHRRLAVGELIRMLEERGTEDDLAEAEERKAQLLMLQAEEEQMRGAALEEARIAMLPRAEKRKAHADARRKSGSKGDRKKGVPRKGGRKKGGKGKAKAGRKKKKGQAGHSTTAEANAPEKGTGHKAQPAAKGSVDREEEGPAEALEAGEEAARDGEERVTSDKESDQEEEGKDDEEEECCICLSPLIEDPDDPLGLLACGHSLHDECIDSWNSSCQSKGVPASCPLCRSSLNRL